MTPRSWVRKVFARPAARPIRRATPHRPRLGVEPLEDRAVPATFTVTNTNDTGVGSLRDAVAAANGAAGPDAIVFDTAGVFATARTITVLTPITFNDTATTTVTGTTAGVSVSGGGSSQVFFVDPGALVALDTLTVSNGSSTNGGGIRNQGTLTVSNSTFINHTAQNGGGLYADAGSTTTLTNVTFSNNSASVNGGAFYNAGTATLTDVTVSRNTAGVGGGLAMAAAGATTTLSNTIVAGNTAPTGPDAASAASYTSLGNNLIGKTDGSAGWVGSDLTGTVAAPLDPVLAPLGFYGGPTRTMALGVGSPAIDAGTGTGTDQRGFVVSTNDIGAFEVVVTVDVNRFVVSTTADSGAGSLRQAITDANTTAAGPVGADTIVFNLPGAGPYTIAPTSALPSITQTAVVDGTTQPGYGGTPTIEIDGQNAGNSYGLVVNTAAASNSTIFGLVVNRFQLSGIFVTGGASGVVVRGNYVGTDFTGTLDRGNGTFGVDLNNAPNATVSANRIAGNDDAGIVVAGSSSGAQIISNTIGLTPAGTALPNANGGIIIQAANATVGGGTIFRNLISGNTGSGISLTGPGATGATILNNYIGLAADGSTVVGNGNGIVIEGGAANNTVGGTTAADRNVISGNDRGVVVNGATTAGNVISGNYIGTDATGLLDRGNTNEGVRFQNDAPGNTLGGTVAGAGNVISGNDAQGVLFLNAGAGNLIAGNTIGLGSNGTTVVGNGGDGVSLADTDGTTVGGTVAAARNVIGGNAFEGLLINFGSANTVVVGNYFGTDATGTLARGNGNSGVLIANGSTNATIGGTTAAERNVISGNAFNGNVALRGAGGNTVSGNYIGTNAAGTAALGGNRGVLIDGASTGNTVGGTAAGAGNVISGNGGDGVMVSGAGATGNLILGNSIGTNAAGTAALGNGLTGVVLSGGASTNTVGGATAAARNVISGNAGSGVWLLGAGTTANVVQGNYIGTDANGTADLGNTGDGVVTTTGADANAIIGNVVSGNDATGILLQTNANTVQGNRVGTDPTGTADLGNALSGVWMYGGSANTVGVDGDGVNDAAEGNVISGNGTYGVYFQGDSNDNVVAGNRIGTNAAGTAAVANTNGGVSFFNDFQADNTRIGTDADGTSDALERNVIAGNANYGIVDFAIGTVIAGNYVGILADGVTPLANSQGGITLGGQGTTVGGLTTAARNVISGNAGFGVSISGALGFGTNNTVAGNFVGTDAAGTAAVPNAAAGVRIDGGASTNTVGGTAAGARNVISGNAGDGVFIQGIGTTANVVLGNYIGTNAAGTIALGNSGSGVTVLSSSANRIGGGAAGAGNVIGGNGGYGVDIGGSNSFGGDANAVQGNRFGTNAAGMNTIANLSGYDVFIHFNASSNVIGTDSDGANDAGEGNLFGGTGAAAVGVTRTAGFTPPTGTVIAGNWIALNAAGTASLGGYARGVWLRGAVGTRVGTDADGTNDAGERNVIVPPTGQDGVLVSEGATNTTIAGNYIGTNPAGTAALGGGGTGVAVGSAAGGATNTVVGGPAAAARNLISGLGVGVDVFGPQSTATQVLGNFIGTDAAGATAIPNGTGVQVRGGASNSTIGGTAPGAGNTIAFNAGPGVAVTDGTTTGNAVRGNSIFSNGGLGIDLGGAGVTTNDPDDADAGPNRLTNYPLLSFVGGGAATNPRGTLAAAPNTTYALDFYATDAPDPTGYGEGRRYLGSATVTTNAVGRAAVSVNLPAATTTSEYVSVTATDAAGNTSEFSQAVRTNQAPTVTLATPAETLVGVTHPFTPVLTDAVPGKTYRYAWAVAFNGSPVALPDATFVADGASDQETFFFTPRRVGSYVVSVTVTDSLGGEVTAPSAPILVTGTTLGVTITGSTAGSPVSFAAVAGQPVTLTSRIADPRQTAFDPKTGLAVVPAYTYRWNVTLGGAQVVLPAGTVTAPTLTFTPNAGGLYLVSLAVQDGAGPQVAAGADSVSLYATAAPAARLIVRPGTAVAAGAVVDLQAVVLDASLRRGLSYRWTVTPDNGDPSSQVTTATGVYAFTPKAAGNYAVALTVTDDQNRTGTADTLVRVARAVPTVTVNAPRTTPPGVPLTVTGSATDADPNRPSSGTGAVYALSWRAIDTTTSQVFATGTGGSFSFTPPSEGNVVVTLTATGPGGVETSYPVVIGVEATDAALTVTPSPNPAQGQPLTWTANLAGAPAGTTYTWSVFGPDGVTRPYSTGTANTLTVPAARPGRYDVTVTAAANGTRYTARPPAAGTSVDVPDAAVNVSIGVGPTGNFFEGDTVTLTGTATAPGVDLTDLSKASYLWTVTGPNEFSEVSVLPTLEVVPLRAGTYTATLLVRDLRGGSGTATATFAVAHAPPKPLLRYVDTGPDGSVGFQAVVSNPAGAYSFVYTVEVNGQPLVTTTPRGASFPFRLPPVAGPTTLRVTVTDSANATGQISTTVRAVAPGTPAAPAPKVVTTADLLPGTDVVVVLAGGYNRVVADPSLTAATTVQFIAVGGFNRFKGGPSTNIFFGDSGTNVLVGGTGPNTFFASGDDTLVGGGGPNRFVPVTIGTETDNVLDVVAGPGPNTLDLSQQDGVTLDLTRTGSPQPFDAVGNAVRLTNTYPDEFGNPVTQPGTFQTVIGTPGADTLTAASGASIVGGGGADLLKSFAVTNVTLAGGSGNNTSLVAQGGGNVSLVGGSGSNASLVAGGGATNVTLVGGSGSNSSLMALSGGVSLVGGSGSNASLVAGAGNVTLVGGSGGNASLVAGAGNVSLVGGSGSNASLVAGQGSSNVTLVGGSGNNASLVAGAGNVSLIGGSGSNASLVAGAGNVSLVGGSGGNASLVAGTGASNVTLVGGSGSNTSLVAGAGSGNVSLVGGSGSNTSLVAGTGAGNVTLVGGSGGNSSLVAGAGNVSLVGGSGSNASLVAQGGNVSLVGGSGSNASLVATTGGVSLVGGSGSNASLVAGAGNVTLIGGSGGNASLVAGAGNVSLVGGSGSNASLVAGTGSSNVTLVGGSGSNASLVAEGGNVSLVGGSGSNASLVAGQGSSNVTLVGGSGSNASLVAGGGSNVTLVGGSGSNATLVAGGSANVSLVGGSGGNASLIAGTGNVSLVGGSGSNASLVAGQGSSNVTLIGGSGSNASIAAGAGSSNVSLVGGSGSNASVVSGTGSINVTLIGGSGNNTSLAAGGGSNVSLIGGSGDGTRLSVVDVADALLFGGQGRNASVSATTSPTGTSSRLTLIGGFGDNATLTASGSVSGVELVGGFGDNNLIDVTGATNAVLVGGFGDGNTLTAAGGNNVVLIGGSGKNNYLQQTGGTNAFLYGQSGSNASLVSSGGTNVSLIGGSGDHLYLVDTGSTNVSLLGGTGSNNRVESVDGKNATVFGGNGNNNSVLASGGHDVFVVGGTGDGNRLTTAGLVNATVFGGAGNSNVLDNTAGTNVLVVGGTGLANKLTDRSGTGNTVVNGGNGFASLTAINGNNVRLFGGGGTDYLTAEGGANVGLFGQNGDNTYVISTYAAANGVVPFTGYLDALGTVGLQQTPNDELQSGSNTILFPTADRVVLDLGRSVGGAATAEAASAATQQVATGVSFYLIGPFSGVVGSAAGNDLIRGNMLPNSLVAGAGDVTLVAGSGDATLVAGSGRTSLVGGSGQTTYAFRGAAGQHTITQPDATNADVIDLSELSGPATLNLATASAQVVSGTLTLTLTHPTVPDVIGSPAGNTLTGNGRDNRYSLTTGANAVTAGSGLTTVKLSGAGLGANTVTAPTPGSVVLNFHQLGGPLAFDLSRASQPVGGGTLTFAGAADARAVASVVGTVYGDVLAGNPAAGAPGVSLYGGGGRDSLTGGAGADLLQAGVPQVVFLDFDTYTPLSPNNHVYTQPERDAIQARLHGVYAKFTSAAVAGTTSYANGYVFTQSRAAARALTRSTGGEFVTLAFNKPPAGGQAEEVDFANADLGGLASVNASLILGATGEPDRTTQNFINLSAGLAAHELAHLAGLRHTDAFGPIGSGGYQVFLNGLQVAGLDPDKFLPVFQQPAAAQPVTTGAIPLLDGTSIPAGATAYAAETPLHVMGSPASLGITRFDTLNDLFLGEREAIRLAFSQSGVIVPAQAAPHGSLATARDLGVLPGLVVPNTLAAGARNAGQPFAVQALAVVGSIGLDAAGRSRPDWYAFTGRAGDFMSFETISRVLPGNPRPLDTILRVYDAAGTLLAQNDDELESLDSLVFDFRVPADGRYHVQVDTWAEDGTVNTSQGDYLLYATSFRIGATAGGGSTLVAGPGGDVLYGGQGNNSFRLAPNAGPTTVIGGNGADVLDRTAAPLASVTVITPAGNTGVVQVVPVVVTPGGPFAATAAVPTGSLALATVLHPGVVDQASSYTATIDWGDGTTPSTVALTGPAGGPFQVADGHTYAAAGTFTVTVTVTRAGSAPVTATAAVSVSFGQVTATGGINAPFASAISSAPVVATFTDPNGAGAVTLYSASINWGDGQTSTGTITGPVGGVFSVSAPHTYFVLAAAPTITVSVARGTAAPVTVTSAAVVGTSVVALSPSLSGAVTLSGSAAIGIGGALVVNSNSASALTMSGSARVTAGSVRVRGGYARSGSAQATPAPATGSAALADPLAGLPAPPNPGGALTNANIGGNSTVTLNPGRYSQITVGGSARVTLNPGVYVIAGGGLSVSGSASLTGNGVMIYVAGSSFPAAGGSFNGVSFSGSAAVNLTPAATGTYAGIALFQARDNNRAMTFSGSAREGINGFVYAPNALLTLSGSVNTVRTGIVVDRLNTSGSASSSQVAAGSGTEDGSPAGELLSTSLAVYVDGPEEFSPAQLARIADAITGIDAVIEPYGVDITRVSDPADANVVIDLASTSVLGGLSNGVLGVYDPVYSHVTLIDGWDWYAGADPAGIGAGQFDFQSVVTHELGHALGLGHLDDPASVMFEALTPGTVKRTLLSTDLNIGNEHGLPGALYADLSGWPEAAEPTPADREEPAPRPEPEPTDPAGASAPRAVSPVRPRAVFLPTTSDGAMAVAVGRSAPAGGTDDRTAAVVPAVADRAAANPAASFGLYAPPTEGDAWAESIRAAGPPEDRPAVAGRSDVTPSAGVFLLPADLAVPPEPPAAATEPLPIPAAAGAEEELIEWDEIVLLAMAVGAAAVALDRPAVAPPELRRRAEGGLA